ncbi:MAG: hypothetical protein ACYCS8_05970 [Acidithiobacillus sp.]
MGTMEGFLLGQATAPTSEYNSGPMWRAHAEQEEARADQNYEAAEAWKAEAEKLSASLEKEHKRFLVERRERRDYMRGWATRGAILREECGYTKEMIDEGQNNFGQKYDEKLTRIAKETDAEIDAEAGF